MNPRSSAIAPGFAETHVSEELTVNRLWDVSSDGNLCVSSAAAFEEELVFFAGFVYELDDGINMQQ